MKTVEPMRVEAETPPRKTLGDQIDELTALVAKGDTEGAEAKDREIYQQFERRYGDDLYPGVFVYKDHAYMPAVDGLRQFKTIDLGTLPVL